MLKFTERDLVAIWEKLLAMDPVPAFRLLRDILRVDRADADYVRAEKRLKASKWIALLDETQLRTARGAGFIPRTRNAHRFDAWKKSAAPAMNWIRELRDEEGFWNLGNQIAKKHFTCFPLSESWKKRKDRLIDCTLVVLDLLMRCFTDRSPDTG